MQNEHSAIAKWRSTIRKASGSFTPWTAQTDEGNVMFFWLKEMLAHLQLARKVKIDDQRADYFYLELQAMGYDPNQAQRAEMWIKYGDWTFKGTDPTLELSDFVPTEDQYNATLTKRNARVDGARFEPRQEQAPQPQKPTMSEQEIKAWALYVLTVKEPEWGIKLSDPLLDQYRSEASAMLAQGKTAPNPKDDAYAQN